MVSVRERVSSAGEVTWQVRFRRGNKETSESFDSPRGRDRFLRNVERLGIDKALAILDQAELKPTSSDDAPTLAEWAARHIDSLTGVGEHTKKRYRAYMRNDLAHLADVPIDQITHEAVAKWVNGMETAKAAPKTIANKHGFLSGVLSRAVARKVIPGNPCEETRLPRGIDHEMVFLTTSEFAHLVHYVPEHYRPLVTTLVGTGMRWSEATALRVMDVDLEHGTARIARAWKKAETGFVVGPPKSKKSNRTVSLAPQVVDLLKPLVNGRDPEAMLFTTPRGAAIRHAVFLQGIWQPAVRLANGEPAEPTDLPVKKRKRASALYKNARAAEKPLGKRPGIHSLRHTAASWMIAAQMDPMDVQYQMGHESITTTYDRYGHLMPHRRKAAAAAMGGMLAQAFPEIEPPDDGPLEITAS